MSYLVLARKYRPRTFGEVTGQENVTGTLQGAISEDRVGHAYLFTGPRGTGKTTTARIFAKALNCERGPGKDPCGECERCLAADSGSEIDIVEIDAASHTGVDNVRELREQAAFAPIRARHKVYIVDEVHMLSKAAFNALLKTLEEPPPHVKFLFATTELHKVPDTILSRCQVLKLTSLSEATISARLREVFEREQVTAGEGVVEGIARRARGGMRDALSLADQLLALVGNAPTVEDVRRLSSGTDRELIESLADALVAGDRGQVLALLPPVEGGEAELLDGLLSHLRASMLCLLCGLETPQVDAEPALRERMAARAKALGPDRMELWLEELLHTRERLRIVPAQSRLVLEVALLALCRKENTIPLAELAERLVGLEQRLAAGGAVPPAPVPARTPNAPAPVPTAPVPTAQAAPTQTAPAPSMTPPPSDAAPQARASAAAPSAPPPAAAPAEDRPRRSSPRPPSTRTMRASATETWKQFLQALSDSAPSLGELYSRGGSLVELGQRRAVVRVDRMNDDDRALVNAPRNQKRCAELLSRLLERDVEFEVQDTTGMRPGSEDPFTREVADLFGGRIED